MADSDLAEEFKELLRQRVARCHLKSIRLPFPVTADQQGMILSRHSSQLHSFRFGRSLCAAPHPLRTYTVEILSLDWPSRSIGLSPPAMVMICVQITKAVCCPKQ